MEYLFLDEAILHVKEETWMMYFGIGVLLMAPDNSRIPLAFKLQFKVSNNEVEYEACIAGLEVTLELGAKRLDVIEDSNLVVSQAKEDWKVKEEKMRIDHQTLDVVIPRFEKLNFAHLLKENHKFADSLATLSSMTGIPFRVWMRPIIIEQKFVPTYELIVARKGGLGKS